MDYPQILSSLIGWLIVVVELGLVAILIWAFVSMGEAEPTEKGKK